MIRRRSLLIKPLALFVLIACPNIVSGSSQPPTFVDLDSIWIDAAPSLGVPFNVSVLCRVTSQDVDSVLVRAYYTYPSDIRTTLGEVETVVGAQFPDTMIATVALSIDQPGQYFIYFWVLAWRSTDTLHGPWGTYLALIVDIPSSGPGAILDSLPWSEPPDTIPSPHNPGVHYRQDTLDR